LIDGVLGTIQTATNANEHPGRKKKRSEQLCFSTLITG
jgi:hypothetical protein